MAIAPVYFGSGPDLAIVAGQDLGGQRAVLQAADGAHYADIGVACEVLGITTAAALHDTLASVRTSGFMTDPSFAFEPGLPVFLGTAGVLTQTPPDPAYGAVVEIIIGTAITDTTLLIRIRQPTRLLA